jgi:hypothetical protein
MPPSQVLILRGSSSPPDPYEVSRPDVLFTFNPFESLIRTLQYWLDLTMETTKYGQLVIQVQYQEMAMINSQCPPGRS